MSAMRGQKGRWIGDATTPLKDESNGSEGDREESEEEEDLGCEGGGGGGGGLTERGVEVVVVVGDWHGGG